MANLAEIKSALHQQVANMEDEKVLQKVQHYFHSLVKDDKKIIAYNAKGKALTTKEYKSSIEESIAQYRKGKWVSQKEMDKKL
ncbi:MAG: hypothetical protein ACOVMQ_04465 [Cyclobacteriaceae bacterium]|jgi:hypothetical protein